MKRRKMRRPRPGRGTASEEGIFDQSTEHSEGDGTRQARRKSDLTTFRFLWLDGFSLIEGPTLIDRRIGERLVGYYAGLSGTYSHFANVGAVVVWPSVETLACDLQVSERTVRYATHRLERYGVIEAQRTKGGAGKVNRYRLLPQNPAAILAGLNEAGALQRSLQGSETETLQSDAPKPCKSGPENPARAIAYEYLPSEGRVRRPSGAHAEESRGALRGATPLRGDNAPRAPETDGEAIISILENRRLVSACEQAEEYLDSGDLKTLNRKLGSFLQLDSRELACIGVTLLALYNGRRQVERVLSRLQDNNGELNASILTEELLEQAGGRARPRRSFDSLRDLSGWLPGFIEKRTATWAEDDF